MSYLDELRQRVNTAEQQFGQMGEQSRRHSDRLQTLVDAAEEAIRQKESIIEDQRQAIEAVNEKLGQATENLSRMTAENEKLTAEQKDLKAQIADLEKLKSVAEENEQLRGMLHSLLVAVEAERGQAANSPLSGIENRLSEIVQPGEASTAKRPATPNPTPTAEPTPAADDSDPLSDLDLDLDDSMLAEDGLDPADNESDAAPATGLSPENLDADDEASLKDLVDALGEGMTDDPELQSKLPDMLDLPDSTGVSEDEAERSRDIREITQSLRREVSRLEDSAEAPPKDTHSAVRNWVRRVRKQRAG